MTIFVTAKKGCSKTFDQYSRPQAPSLLTFLTFLPPFSPLPLMYNRKLILGKSGHGQLICIFLDID